MIQINSGDGRLSAWGVTASTVSIRWRKQPSNLPVAGRPLDLRGAKIYADFSDGTSEDITGYCSFTPSQGTPVYDEQYVNVTASYVEKSGKTITADTSLPVCYPAELRLVVSGDVVYESYFNTESPDYDFDTMPLKKGLFTTWCVWKRIDPMTEQEVIIRITPVPDEDVNYIYNPEEGNESDVQLVYELRPGAAPEPIWAISSVENSKEDVENWHNPYSPTVESFERPLEILAQASIVTGEILEATGYIETIPISLSYANLPTTIEEDVPVHLTNENIWFGGLVEGLNDMWLYVGADTDVSAIRSEMDFYLPDGGEGDFYILRRNPASYWVDPSEWTFKYTHYRAKRNGDKLEWRKIEE